VQHFTPIGIIGFVVPVLIGALTNGNMTFSAWKLVFGSAAAVYVVCNMIYVLTIQVSIYLGRRSRVLLLLSRPLFPIFVFSSSTLSTEMTDSIFLLPNW
jgi:hypothetical protein